MENNTCRIDMSSALCSPSLFSIEDGFSCSKRERANLATGKLCCCRRSCGKDWFLSDIVSFKGDLASLVLSFLLFVGEDGRKPAALPMSRFEKALLVCGDGEEGRAISPTMLRPFSCCVARSFHRFDSCWASRSWCSSLEQSESLCFFSVSFVCLSSAWRAITEASSSKFTSRSSSSCSSSIFAVIFGSCCCCCCCCCCCGGR